MMIPAGPHYVDDTLTFTVVTHRFDTGALTDADGVPSYRVYEDETGTAILTGSMAKLDDTNTTGFYSEQITLSAANGFEVGKSYSVYVTAAVNSVTGGQSGGFKVIAAAVSVAADVAAIKAKTDNLPSDPADASDIAASFTAVNTKLDTIDDFLDTEIGAIKTKTDALPADPADASDIAAAFATVNGKLDTIDTVADAILVDTGTDIPAALATITTNIGDVPTAVENADALLNRDMSAVTVTNSRSPINALRILRNKVDVPLGTVYEEDDTTAAWTFATTTDAAAEPIVGVDPT